VINVEAFLCENTGIRLIFCCCKFSSTDYRYVDVDGVCQFWEQDSEIQKCRRMCVLWQPCVSHWYIV